MNLLELLDNRLFVLLSIILFSFNCCTNPTTESEPVTLNFNVEAVESTEIWLNLKVSDTDYHITYIVERDNKIIFREQLDEYDHRVRDDSLSPATNYNYKAYALYNNKKSGEITATASTMDTTNHNFEWQVYNFGGGRSRSVIHDISIVDENSIWAVGEISTEDGEFNAAYWNGAKWELKQIPFTGSCSVVMYPEIIAVYAFKRDDIWFARRGSLTHFDGIEYFNDCRMNSILTGSLNKIWGRSSQLLNVVGDKGNIIEYNGMTWIALESNTEIDLIDVWSSNNNQIVWFCGFDDGDGSVLIRKMNDELRKVIRITRPNIPEQPGKITHIFKSLWSDHPARILLASNGRVYITPWNTNYNAKELFWWDYEKETGYPPVTEAIRGNAINDFFISGYMLNLRHFNGVSWKKYDEFNIDGYFYTLDQKQNIVVAAGEVFDDLLSNAIIAIGKRN